MEVSLSIIWDKDGQINETLIKNNKNVVDKIICENYDNSKQIRNSDEFKEKIEKFLKTKPTPNIRKNYRGSIVILKLNDNLEYEKLKVMYKSDVDCSIKFVKELYNRMLNDKKYTKSILKLYPSLFTEQERISLYTDLKYNYKTYYKYNLRSWKNKFLKSDNYIDNLRKIYKCFEKDIEQIKKQTTKLQEKEEQSIKTSHITEEFLIEQEKLMMYGNDEYKEENKIDKPKKKIKDIPGQQSLFDLE